MARRRIQKPRGRQARPAPPDALPAFHTPFGGLAKRLRAQPAQAPTPRAIASTTPSGRSASSTRAIAPAADEPDAATIFLDEMRDVRRLADSEPRIAAPAPALHLRRAPVSEEAEALAALSDFVAGEGEFDLSDSTEYVEGSVVGLDPRILRRLRRGQFAYQAYLDLHGRSATAARIEVEAFIADAVRVGHRCVLIVHGRGRNSRDGIPILKERLKGWLARGRVGRAVLAFTSALSADGGTGAVYVLLRRRRGVKERIAVYDGAKRE
jgi:DNA-nicking Smr family endonuclease